ncbi:YIP1 family protein [Yoonia sp. SDW83-1]|uniref:YIP1 family protein n=1 Tax=Yoonia sp. SDW83-1 TaxID=3366945 RepID=UPI00398C82D7
MSVDFQSWMRAVWMSLLEPAHMARKAIDLRIDMRSLWMGLALIVILNVLLLALMQVISPVPDNAPPSPLTLSPWALTGVLGLFMVLMVYGTYFAGQIMDGIGDLHATLTIIVWFHAINLTLEVIQIGLILISPQIGLLFGMVALGALLWCFLNFINVLHEFNSLGKSFVAFVLSLFGVGVVALIILAMVGVSLSGGTI